MFHTTSMHFLHYFSCNLHLHDEPLHVGEDTFNSINSKGIRHFCKRVFKHLQLHMTTADFAIIQDILRTYNDLSFHNIYHAIDVMHLSVILLQRWKHYASMRDNEKKCFIFIALGHDAGHGGKQNNDVANEHVLQSDASFEGSHTGSFNETQHAHVLQSILHDNHFSTKFLNIHKFILMTDLAHQKEFLDTIEKNKEWEQILILKLADIGHVFRPWNVHRRFVDAILMETGKRYDTQKKCEDTIMFNTTFVYPLLERYEACSVNTTDLFTAYKSHINTWNVEKKVNKLIGRFRTTQ